MTKTERILLIGMLLLGFISSIGLGFAAPGDVVTDAANSGGTGGMKLTTSTFTEGMSWAQLAPVMPLAEMVLLFVIFAYGLSCFLAIFAGSAKANVGSILKSNDLRNEGHKGVLSVILGAGLMVFALIMMFVIWNNYGIGAW